MAKIRQDISATPSLPSSPSGMRMRGLACRYAVRDCWPGQCWLASALARLGVGVRCSDAAAPMERFGREYSTASSPFYVYFRVPEEETGLPTSRKWYAN